MNDELHPDAVDDELRRRFAAGPTIDGDPDVVLDALRPRLRLARSRRRASFASAIAGVAVVVVVLVFVLGGADGGSGSVHVPPATDRPRPIAPTTPATTAPTAGPDTQTTIVSGTNGGGTLGEDATGATPTTPANLPPDTSPTTASILQQGYTSEGGSITVDFVDGRASLRSSAPAPGYRDEVHDTGPSRIEVRFSNGETEWRIRVDVVDGHLQPAEITQHG